MPRPLDKLFDAHAAATHCSKATVNAELRPVASLAGKMRRQFAEYRDYLNDATLQDDSLTPRVEVLYQTFAAGDREIAALEHAIRQCALVLSQCDRYMAEIRSAMADDDARGAR